MINKSLIKELVDYFNKKLKSNFKDRLESAYLVGSYPLGKVSLARPDINWLLIWKGFITGEDNWKLGELLTSTIDSFQDKFVVRPEFRPFKFAYPVKKGKDEVFVNIASAFSADSAEGFKKKNSFIPEYVFAGFKDSRKLIFGKDILADIEFKVTKQEIQASAREKIVSHHKIQLDRVPLVYHLERDIDLVFNEALSHGKNLVYFAVELLMTEEELEKRNFFNLFRDKRQLLNFFKERLPKVEGAVSIIMESKEHYPEWKIDKRRAKKLFLASSELTRILLKKFVF